MQNKSASDTNVTHKPPYGTPSTIREIVESIVLLAHAKGVANEGFVNVDFYVEQLEKEVEKAFQAGEARALKNTEKLVEKSSK